MFYEFTSIKICISQMSILKKMMKDWRWFRQVMASKKVILCPNPFRDERLADQVRAGDAAIDALEEQVNAECARLIALRAPMGTDLRTVLSVMKIASNLERCGDYAKNLAKRTKVLAEMQPLPEASGSLKRMRRKWIG